MNNLPLGQLKSLFLKNIYFWSFFLISLIFFSIWWLAFFPGFISPDSINQWQQINELRFNNWHPYIHTLYLLLLRLIWDNPAIVSLFQIIATSSIFAWIFNFCCKKNAKRWLIFILFFFFVTSIPVGVYSITLWKDTVFSLTLLSTSFYFAKLHLSTKKWTFYQLIILLTGSLLTIFFRHNGLMYIVIFPLLTLIFFNDQKKRTLQYIASLGVLFFTLHNILPNLLSVTPEPFWFSRLFLYQATAGFYARLPNSYLTPETKVAMESIMPGATIKELYNPINTNPVIFGKYNSKINVNALQSHDFWNQITKDFFRKNLMNNLSLFLSDKNKMMYAVLTGEFYAMDNTIAPNNLGIKPRPLIEQLHTPLSQFLEWMLRDENKFIRSMIWSTWFSLLILIILTIAAILKNRRYFLVFSLPLLFHVPILYVFNVANDWRYLYFIYLSIFVAIPLWLIPNTKSIKP